jgi:hypothetical protein
MKTEIEMQEITLPTDAEVKIEFSVTAKIHITKLTAQRKVSRLLLDRVANLLYGEQPSLVVGERMLWRVPVWISLPTTGPLGQVGSLDVDTQSGEILFTPELLAEIKERANALAKRATSQAG